ncbi:MAG: competence type IV pilus major pilin ComGC [Phycisphaerales bacterium JB037]
MNEMMNQTKPVRPIRFAARRAFSLLEITLVLAIIGVLMAVAAVNIFGASERANIRATQASLETIGTALKDYALNHQSNYPATLSVLVQEKFLEDKALTDAWGQPFYFSPTQTVAGNPFQLLSGGPDKEVGTEDDIDYWNKGT